MKLSELLRDVPVRELHGDTNVDITGVTPDSRPRSSLASSDIRRNWTI